MAKTQPLSEGDFMSYEELSRMFYVTGMETWDGKMIAEAFNRNCDSQVEYSGDSFWRITRAGEDLPLATYGA